MWLNTMHARRVSFDPQALQPDTRIQCVGNCKPTQRPSWHLAIQQGYFVIMPLSLVKNHATVIQSFSQFFHCSTALELRDQAAVKQLHSTMVVLMSTNIQWCACELSKTGCETAFSSAEEFSPLSVAQAIDSRLLMGNSYIGLNDQCTCISISQTATDTAISQAGHKLLLFSQHIRALI